MNVLPISERDLQAAVIDLAHLLGWRVAHFRPAQTRGRWTTPVSADGAGFPDLVLARRGKVIFAEIKTKTGRVRPGQAEWLDALGGAFIWRPDDWFSGRIQEVLR